jgi:hypothetical protein
MAGKQYGLKIVHKPSNTVTSEKWFSTESERNSAMAGSTMEPHYIFVVVEKEADLPEDAKPVQ